MIRSFIVFVLLLGFASNTDATDLAAQAQGGCKGGAIAFPGAKGWGKCATGWRNGQIIKVTNTNDSGVGSLRAALDTDGPRVIMFDVGGSIEVTSSQLQAAGSGANEQGNVYIAGQSAPSDSGGIEIKLSASGPNVAALAFLQVDHVLVRHLRLRPGPGDLLAIGNSISGITFRNVRHFMVDHTSLMYAADQNFTTTAQGFSIPADGITRYGTLQRSIVAYGLHAANHTDTTHSKGALACSLTIGSFSTGDRCGYFSFIENYFAHNNDRNPEIQQHGEPFEIVNNIFYNPFSEYIEFVFQNQVSTVNIISNASFEGSNTRDTPTPNLYQCRDITGDCEAYMFGNINEDNRPASNAGQEDAIVDGLGKTGTILTSPGEAMAGSIIRAEDLSSVLLPDVGATTPARDALDTLVTGQCCPGNAGARVDDPTDVTGTGITDGYPTLAAGTPPTDTDGDGMPDDWEQAFPNGQLLAFRFDAWADRDGDGWSNLEEYLNFRAGDIPDPRP